MTRLRRSSPEEPGLIRRRRGRGWQYLDPAAGPVDQQTRRRIEALAIPPAWREVWICRHPRGHLQAVGTDAAGRRQYLYHPDWTERRARRKFSRTLEFSGQLPSARRQVREHLALPGMPVERSLAAAFRLLDLGQFRIGSEVYAERHGSFGLATVRRDDVRTDTAAVVFDYVGKSGLRRIERIDDPALADALLTLKRRRSGGPELLAYRDADTWRAVGSAQINEYLKEVIGPDFSAKDFRTWHGTVLAAVALALADRERPSQDVWTSTARRRAVSRAIAQVADVLGNTPAVCRSSYVDPRTIEAFERGRTIARALGRVRIEPGGSEPEGTGHLAALAAAARVERAVRKLLRSS